MGKKLIIPSADFSVNAIQVKSSLVEDMFEGLYAGFPTLVFFKEGDLVSNENITGWRATNLFRPKTSKIIIKTPTTGTVRIRQYDEAGNSVRFDTMVTNSEITVTPSLRTGVNMVVSPNMKPTTSLSVFPESEAVFLNIFDV